MSSTVFIILVAFLVVFIAASVAIIVIFCFYAFMKRALMAKNGERSL